MRWVAPEDEGRFIRWQSPERDRCQGRRQLGAIRLAAVTFVAVVVRLRSLCCALGAFLRENERGVLHAHRG